MLSLGRKVGQQVYLGSTPLTITEVTPECIILNFKGQLHVVEKGKMFDLEETTLCYTQRKGSYAKIQFKSPHKVLRGEIYAGSNTQNHTTK